MMADTEDLEFTISQHFISSAQLAIALLSPHMKNNSPWRWIIIAIHDAIYCALVMKLTRTDLWGVYPSKLEKEVHSFYERGLDSRSMEWVTLDREQNRSKLASLEELLDRANLPSGARIHKIVPSDKGLARSITLLKRRRDMFVHAGDYSLFATEVEMKEICRGSVEVLREIMALPGHRRSCVAQTQYDCWVNKLRDALYCDYNSAQRLEPDA